MYRFVSSTITLLFTAVFLTLFSSGCAPKPESKMNDLASAVKASVNPTNLQSWAIEILKTNTPYSAVSEDKLPLDISSLRKQGFQLEPDILESNCVFLVCSKTYKFFGCSCDGFFGICVGSPTFRPIEGTRSYTNWMPGIYFWYDREMM
jgi:hypothetical protein